MSSIEQLMSDNLNHVFKLYIRAEGMSMIPAVRTKAQMIAEQDSESTDLLAYHLSSCACKPMPKRP